MRLAALLRLTAIGIVLLALIDPPLQIAPQPPLVVSVAVADSRFGAMPAGTGAGTRADAAREVVARLEAALGAEADVRVSSFSDGDRLPCGAQDPCVVVSDGVRDVVVPADRRGPTSVISVGGPLTPNLTIVAARGFASHVAAEGLLKVTLAGAGVSGRSTDLTVKDGDAIVGQVTHEWASDESVTLDVRWWPLAAGPRVLRVDAAAFAGEQSAVDNGVDVAVEVREGRTPVLVYEPRPSFASTFVRRALESDARFLVDARTRLGGVLAAGTPDSRLDIAALDRHPVVVVGAPDALTADEVTRLTSFVRNRGGTLLLMPDRALSGPVMRLISLDWVERLQAEPVVVGTLRASELITADVTQPADETLATTTFGPAIVSTQTGLGRVIVSGALDAWRYRTDGTAYDRFWRAVVADAAAVAGPQVSVAVSPALVSPGGELAVTVHGRSTEPRAEMTAEASWQCASDDARSLRVWPGTPSGTFVATVRVDAKVGDCQVTASISGLGSATGRFLVRNAPRSAPDAAQTGLNGAVAVTGGVRVGADDLGPIVTHLAALRSTNRQPEERHPMRSVWWLLPIAACLSVEWWLRRRGGLK